MKLLRLGLLGLFEPIITEEIIAEWARNCRNGLGQGRSKIVFTEDDLDVFCEALEPMLSDAAVARVRIGRAASPLYPVRHEGGVIGQLSSTYRRCGTFVGKSLESTRRSTKETSMSIAARGATKAVSGVVIGVSLAILSGCALLDTAKAFILAPFTGSPFSTVADVPLSGGANRLDYQNFDEKTGRLFIAHLGSSRVHVLDTATNTVIADVPDIAAAHGVLVVPELRRVYASATGAHEVAVLDADTFKVLARVPAGEAPDGLAYAPAAHALFVSNEGGTRQSVIDTETNRRIAELDLGGESGNSQYDAGTGHVMVNIQPRDEIAEIDPLTRRIVARHAITGAGGAHGLLLDQSNRLAYVAGEAASRLTLVDMKTWQVLDTAAVGGMPDVLALDPRRGLVFMASESGTVSVFKAGSRKLEKLAEGYVAPHAHAIAVDPRTHLLYLPIENVDGQPVVRIARYTGEP